MYLLEWARSGLGRRREDIGQWLYTVSGYLQFASIPPTARASNGLPFRTVLGVFPRSFPGVLNISATLLRGVC